MLSCAAQAFVRYPVYGKHVCLSSSSHAKFDESAKQLRHRLGAHGYSSDQKREAETERHSCRRANSTWQV